MSETPATVLLAPDKFKGSLTASQVVAALTRGLSSADPELHVRSIPVADGGDGTVQAALSAGFTPVPLTVEGPTGDPVQTTWARRGPVAVVELADACGLSRLIGAPDPLGASSRGLGEVLLDVLETDVERIVVGIGGSASTDGGAAMVAALGARMHDTRGRRVKDGGGSLAEVAYLDPSGLHPRLAEVEIVVACDVDNPLTGPTGAAAVYGPQKGAGPHSIALLDTALGHWARLVHEATGSVHRDVAGSGAAGGVGFAAMALLGARLRPGVELVLELVDFDTQVAGADLVVVGEGSLDEQSLRGKAPVGVAAAARRAGVPVVAVCGRRAVSDVQLRAVGIDAAHALTDLEPDPQECIRRGAELLERLAAGLVPVRAPSVADPFP